LFVIRYERRTTRTLGAEACQLHMHCGEIMDVLYFLPQSPVIAASGLSAGEWSSAQNSRFDALKDAFAFAYSIFRAGEI